MSKKDWTNKLQEQLADYQVPVKDDLWASISQSLAQQDSPVIGSSESAKAAKIVMFKRWSAAAALALALAGGVAVYWHQVESNEDTPLAQISSEPKSPIKAMTAVLHTSASTTENVDASAGTASPTGSASSENTSSGNTSSGNTPSRNASSGQVSSALLAMASALPKGADAHSLLTSNDASSSQISNDASSSQIYGNQKATKNDVELREQQEEPVVCSMAEEREVAPTSRSKQLMVASRNDHMAKDDALFGVGYANPHSAIGDGMSHSASAVGGDWTVNLFAENMVADHGTGMSNNGYHVLASAPVGFYADQNDFYMTVALQSRSPLYAEAKHHAPLAVGALVGVSVAPRLSLSTGVVYTRVASDFKTVRMDEFNIHQVLHYVGVPLGLNYEFWRKGIFHTYVMAGAQADFNVKNDTEDNGVKVEDAKRDRVQFSGKASLGAQVDVLPSVGIYLEPGAKYYFNNGSKIENTFKDKKWNFNFQFGLRVNL